MNNYLTIDTPLDYETCQRLKKLGFPQHNWPQFVHEGNEEVARYLHSTIFEFIAAPTPLTALAWLEEVKGIKYQKTGSGENTIWSAYHSDGSGYMAESPSDLLDEILEALKVL